MRLEETEGPCTIEIHFSGAEDGPSGNVIHFSGAGEAFRIIHFSGAADVLIHFFEAGDVFIYTYNFCHIVVGNIKFFSILSECPDSRLWHRC